MKREITTNDLVARLTKLETISHERWKTAFNEFSDITQLLKNIENKRYSRLFYYYLNEVFYNIPKRILKFIIK